MGERSQPQRRYFEGNGRAAGELAGGVAATAAVAATDTDRDRFRTLEATFRGHERVRTVAAEALTSVLIGINRAYKADGAGIRITGIAGS